MFNIEESHKIRNEKIKNSDLFSEIELALSRSCNLSCISCPHSINEYKSFNKNEIQFMSLDMVKNITLQLVECNFKGMIDLAGLGEPTLNPNFIEIIKILKTIGCEIRIITNGLKLLKEDFLNKFLEVINDKNIEVNISAYSTKNIKFFEDLSIKYKNINVKPILFDNKDINQISNEFSFNNRAGMVNLLDTEFKYKTCFYPFFMLFIHTNGNYQYCPHSWKYDLVEDNIENTGLVDFWKKHTLLRENMITNNRDNNKTCKSCNVKGTLIGEDSYNDYKRQYKLNLSDS
jgi:radical SAM protein with 4Fe4S-binding SPASM domain